MKPIASVPARGGTAMSAGTRLRMRRRMRARAAFLTLVIAGCAPLATQQAPPRPAGGSAAPAHSGEAAPPSPRAGASRAAVADTVPSRDAERVLATIPEPLAPGQRVPPPKGSTAAPRTAAAPDSSRKTSPAPPDSSAPRRGDQDSTGVDSTGRDVPIPEPTAPLGERAGALDRMMSDSTATADSTRAEPPAKPAARPAPSAGGAVTAPRTGTAPPSGAGAAPPSGAGARSECFRLQIGAPADSRKAEGLRKAAASQLDLAFDVLHTRGLYKVRTHSCLNREAVDHLRARALAAGFRGVFAVRDGTP